MKKTIFLSLISLFILINFVWAQKSGFDLIQDKTMKILVNIIRFVFSILMLGGGLLLIFLGIKYIFAKGRVEELHRSLFYLIIGLVLLITSFFIPNLIKNFIESSIQ